MEAPVRETQITLDKMRKEGKSTGVAENIINEKITQNNSDTLNDRNGGDEGTPKKKTGKRQTGNA